jgi:hypothetical protein
MMEDESKAIPEGKQATQAGQEAEGEREIRIAIVDYLSPVEYRLPKPDQDDEKVCG